MLYDADQAEDLRYFVALLNSSLLTFRFRQIGKLKSSVIIEYFWNSVSKLRIHRIDFQSGHDRAFHDALTQHAAHVEDTVTRTSLARTAHEEKMLERQVVAAGREIDRLVYKFYGLTTDEIALVESSFDTQ